MSKNYKFKNNKHMETTNKNTKIVGAVIIVIVLGLSFYSGMRYGGNNVAAAAAARGANFQNRGVGGVRGGAGGGTAGNIISKDATSVTVGLRDGGSKIVFFSPSTSILTSASGTPADLIAGKQVVVQGAANKDGSVSATNIQVR
jgi:hypothetical protein